LQPAAAVDSLIASVLAATWSAIPSVATMRRHHGVYRAPSPEGAGLARQGSHHQPSATITGGGGAVRRRQQSKVPGDPNEPRSDASFRPASGFTPPPPRRPHRSLAHPYRSGLSDSTPVNTFRPRCINDCLHPASPPGCGSSCNRDLVGRLGRLRREHQWEGIAQVRPAPQPVRPLYRTGEALRIAVAPRRLLPAPRGNSRDPPA